MNPYPPIYFDSLNWPIEALPGRGSIPADYAIVGTAPSMNRPASRKFEPFGASSFQLVMNIVSVLGETGSVYITNLVKTPRPFGKTTAKDVRSGYPILMDELKFVKPAKILAVGTQAAEVLCPGFYSLREDHGTLFWNSELEAIVVPTHHFSIVRGDPQKEEMLVRDLQRFELERHEEAPYLLNPKISDLHLEPDVIIDVETTGVKWDDRITLIGLCNRQDKTVAIWTQDYLDGHPDFTKILYKKLNSRRVIGHNLSFDLLKLSQLSGGLWFELPNVMDTMLMAHAIGEEILSLKHLVTMFTDRPGSRAFGGTTDYGYLAEDVLGTAELCDVLQGHGGIDSYAARLMNAAVPYVTEMAYRGVKLDTSLLRKISADSKQSIKQFSKELLGQSEHEINLRSPMQVPKFLLDQGVPLTVKTPTGNYSTSESSLLQLSQYPVVKKLLEFKAAQKREEFLNDYLLRVTDVHPFIHPKLKLAGARTGRLSCEDPNVQQVERNGPIKTLYVSRFVGGKLGLIDLSQAELRVACMLSGDQKFMKALLSEDVHRTIASWVYHQKPEDITATQRKRSKAITFGLLYGGSVDGLAKRAGMSEKDVEYVVYSFFNEFTTLRYWMDSLISESTSTRSITTPTGRIRNLTQLIAIEGLSSAERKMVNTPIQGTASDIALSIMILVAKKFRELRMRSRVLFGVHDSILIDFHPDEVAEGAIIVQSGFEQLKNSPLAELELWGKLPFVGELVIGDSWAAVESTNDAYSPISKIPCSTHPDRHQGGQITEEDIEDIEVVEEDGSEEESNDDTD